MGGTIRSEKVLQTRNSVGRTLSMPGDYCGRRQTAGSDGGSGCGIVSAMLCSAVGSARRPLRPINPAVSLLVGLCSGCAVWVYRSPDLGYSAPSLWRRPPAMPSDDCSKSPINTCAADLAARAMIHETENLDGSERQLCNRSVSPAAGKAACTLSAGEKERLVERAAASPSEMRH
jgi:hypothetical protein